MKNLIACCGLDCEKCEARKATITNDDNLREIVAKKWTELNQVLITKEMINCEGCRVNGVKTPFCDKLCSIRKCVLEKNFETCGDCELLDNCSKIAMIISYNKQALNNLKSNNNK